VARPVHRGGDDLILQTEQGLGFRRGAGGRCAGMNESTCSVWLGRHPYLFAQGTCRNGHLSYWQEGPVLVATGILPHRLVATVIVISNGRSGITHARCYCDLSVYTAIVFP
jgi:hypothetical protein